MNLIVDYLRVEETVALAYVVALVDILSPSGNTMFLASVEIYEVVVREMVGGDEHYAEVRL